MKINQFNKPKQRIGLIRMDLHHKSKLNENKGIVLLEWVLWKINKIKQRSGFLRNKNKPIQN